MRYGKRCFALLLVLAFAAPWLTARAALTCSICGGLFTEMVYTGTDRTTGEVKEMCYTCATWPIICSICGLPARKDPLELDDGRVLCGRDARNAVLTEEEGVRICSEMRDALDRLFSRFISFPDGTNVDVGIVDRVNLMELFQTPGNDIQCPNVLGYTQFLTNENNEFRYSISLMSALPKSQFKAVCAHEYAHCWIHENLSPERMRSLSRNAHEGFCELVAYMLMTSQNEEHEKKAILQNPYSRGQINLFIEAEKRFGFNDIVDWMKSGTDAALDKNDLRRVRDVEVTATGRPPSTPAVLLSYAAVAPSSDTLVLRSISWIQNHPLATINDRSFSIGESGKVRLGASNVVIRCLAIATNSARIQIVGAREEQVLKLREKTSNNEHRTTNIQ